jgi:hypothetical protein
LLRKNRGVAVRKRGKASFDPKIFLAKVGEGKTVSKYWKDQIESRVSFFMNKFRKLGFIEAPRPASPSAGKFRQGRQAGADRGKVQSGTAGGDDRHDPTTENWKFIIPC